MGEFMSASDAVHGIGYLYVYTYGGPVLLLVNKDGRLMLLTEFSDRTLLRGMALLARVLKTFQPSPGKFIASGRLVAFFGRHYITMAIPRHPRYSPAVLGLLRRLTETLDAAGVVSVEDVKEIVRRVLGIK